MKAAALNLRHLRALAAAVKAGSISGAANAIGLTQPGVTQAIGRLEAVTGTRLLERSTAGVAPTDGGILLAARAEAAMAALAAAFRPYRQGGTGGRAGAELDISMAQLQALLALAEGGSYAAGAAATGVTQPSLHRAVGDLERLCGVALAERKGRGVALTEAGTRLARACRLAAAELEAAMDELAVLAGRDQGAIRIGAAPAALARLLPAATARFLAKHPPVRVELEAATAATGTRLADGLLDALIAFEAGDAREGMSVEPLFQVQMRVVGRHGHPLANAPAPGLVRLASFGWAIPAGEADERQFWEKMFLAGGLYPPAASVTCDAGPPLLALLAGSDLLTLLSSEAIEAHSGPALAVIGDPVAGSRRRLVLMTRSAWYPTPAQAAYLDEVRALAAEFASF